MNEIQISNLNALLESIEYRQKKLDVMLDELNNVPWWRCFKERRMLDSCKRLLEDIDKDIALAITLSKSPLPEK